MIRFLEDIVKAITPTVARIIGILFHPAVLQVLLLFLTAKWYEEAFPLSIALVLGILLPFGIYLGISRLLFPKESVFASREKELKIWMIILNIFCLYTLTFFIPEASVRVERWLDTLILLNGSLLFAMFFYNISLHAVGTGFFIYALIIDTLILQNFGILRSYEVSTLVISGIFLFLSISFLSFIVLFSRYRLGAHSQGELLFGFAWGLLFVQVLTGIGSLFF